MVIYTIPTTELEQIRGLVTASCGSPNGPLNLESFTTLMTGLGYSQEQCPQCYRSAVKSLFN